jgi:hypothetical protein
VWLQNCFHVVVQASKGHLGCFQSSNVTLNMTLRCHKEALQDSILPELKGLNHSFVVMSQG